MSFLQLSVKLWVNKLETFFKNIHILRDYVKNIHTLRDYVKNILRMAAENYL